MKNELLDAAWEEVQIHSLRFTMADIARRMHMSKTSIYKLVESKDQLIHNMVDDRINKFRQVIQHIDESEEVVTDKVHRFVKAYISFIKPMLSSGFYKDLEYAYPGEYVSLKNFYGEQVAYVGTLLEKGVTDGIFHPINLAVVQHALYVSTAAMLDVKFLEENNLTYAQALENLEELLFHGLLK